MIGDTEILTTLEKNCANNVFGKLGIGSKIERHGSLHVITHFSKPYVRNGERVIDFTIKEIQTDYTPAEEGQDGGAS